MSALIHEPTFRRAAGHGVFEKARLVKNWGNDAAHSDRPVKPYTALSVVSERISFLADRVALVKQAANAFKNICPTRHP